MKLYRGRLMWPVVLILLLYSPGAKGESSVPDSIYKVSDSVEFVYSKPKPWSFVTNFPKDYAGFGKLVWRKESIPVIAGVAATTVLFWVFDQQIVDNVQHFSREIGVPGTTQTTKLIDWSVKMKNSSISLPLLVPQDVNSSFYFLGDGSVHIAIASGYWIYGLAANDYRARTTASQLAEAMLTVGVATQFLKHVTGRECPFTQTAPRGVWRVFPNQSDYSKHVPHYDAYPSGHLATAMATVTIIADNYPEYKYIRPLGYTLMTLLGYSMLNNGVHWLSDYPLGIALGYGFAKVITNRSRHEIARPVQSHAWMRKLHPMFMPDLSTGTGIGLVCTF